jgi:hypothetical protein
LSDSSTRFRPPIEPHDVDTYLTTVPPSDRSQAKKFESTEDCSLKSDTSTYSNPSGLPLKNYMRISAPGRELSKDIIKDAK